MLNKILKTIKQYSMLKANDSVLVGVSGGADSIALLMILNTLTKKIPIKLTVGHLNHMIRGDKAEQEAGFVKSISEYLNIDCILGERDVPLLKKNKKISMQEAAREARYEFFFEAAKKINAQKIALGHNADDQAETLIMRLLRGSSLKGLCSIPPVRDNIIRPLISVKREEIEFYLKNLNQPYIKDESYKELNYLRNRVRHHLIPMLREHYNPETVSTLSKTAEMLRNDYDFIDSRSHDWVSRYSEELNSEIYCNINNLLNQSPSQWGRFIIKMVEKIQGNTRKVSYKHIEEVKELIKSKRPSGFTRLPCNLYVLREYHNLVFTKKHPFAGIPFLYKYDKIPNIIHINEINRTLKLKEYSSDSISILKGKISDNEALFDLNKTVFPLTVRNWSEGDRFSPEGLGGSKKVKNFFSDLKIPARLRKQIPLLLFGDKIAWICGCRTDEHFKVDKKTITFLHVTLE